MTWGTLTIKDSANTDRTVPAFDVSGVGTGPYIIGHTIVSDSGNSFATAEENAAAMTTLLGIAGRYDSTDRVLGDGDAGAIALTIAGQVRVVIDDVLDDFTRQLGRTQIANADESLVNFTQQVAHDAVDSGNPTKFGFKAREGVADVTLVLENDRSDQYGTLDGKLLNFPYCGPADIVDGEGTATASTANVAVLAAAGSGIRNYVTTITATNTSGTDTEVAIKDGTTTKMTLSVPANGGVIVNLPVPMRGTANTAFNFAALDSVSSVLCAMVGFTSRA